MNISVISITIQDYHFLLVIDICTHIDLLLLRRKKGTRCPFISILWFCLRTDVKSIHWDFLMLVKQFEIHNPFSAYEVFPFSTDLPINRVAWTTDGAKLLFKSVCETAPKSRPI